MVQWPWETVQWFFKKLHVQLRCDIAIPLLVTHPKGTKVGTRTSGELKSHCRSEHLVHKTLES